MDVDSSRSIVEDYVAYRLERNGLAWQNGQRDVTPNEIQRAMRALGDEFESKFSAQFDDMMSQLQLTPDTAYQTFRTIVTEIFHDGVNWGRIVALFGLAGRLAVLSSHQEMPRLIESIVDWVSAYVDTNLKQWITDHDGWVRHISALAACLFICVCVHELVSLLPLHFSVINLYHARLSVAVEVGVGVVAPGDRSVCRL